MLELKVKPGQYDFKQYQIYAKVTWHDLNQYNSVFTITMW
jgi:hypothetical protein